MEKIVLFGVAAVAGLVAFGGIAVGVIREPQLAYAFLYAILGVVVVVIASTVAYGHFHPEAVLEGTDLLKHMKQQIDANVITGEEPISGQ